MNNNPSVKEIVEKWLMENGYSGLYSDECGCEITDLMPCSSEDAMNCKAGYKVQCNKKCDHDVYITNGWHIQEKKPIFLCQLTMIKKLKKLKKQRAILIDNYLSNIKPLWGNQKDKK